MDCEFYKTPNLCDGICSTPVRCSLLVHLNGNRQIPITYSINSAFKSRVIEFTFMHLPVIYGTACKL